MELVDSVLQCGLRQLIRLCRNKNEGNLTLQHHVNHQNVIIQNIWMNGVRAGEFAIDTAIAGEYGVPVIMTSGCDKLCAEASAFLPQVVTCQVKRSISCQSAMLLAPVDAEQLLRKQTASAIEKLKNGEMKPYCNPETVTIRTEYIERCEPALGLVADRTVERSGSSIEKVFLGL